MSFLSEQVPYKHVKRAERLKMFAFCSFNGRNKRTRLIGGNSASAGGLSPITIIINKCPKVVQGCFSDEM